MTKNGKRIIVSVINDLVTDQRVSRTCHELHSMGYEVLLIGRKLPGSLPMPSLPYAFKRMNLVLKKGAGFYATFNLRLFFRLLFTKADILWSNDLDTLLANYWAGKIKRKPVIFDSHEFFTEVPELEHNQFAKKVWLKIERKIVPGLYHCITVNQSIARLFKERYNKDFTVIRNIPARANISHTKSRKDLGIPEDKTILIIQGSGLNMDRGCEELVEALQLLPEKFHLLFVGSGDVLDKLKSLSAKLNLESRIQFIPKLPYEEMLQYTRNADAGITLDKPTNINYKLSLPNKIFDYIQSGIPVISSDLPELRMIIEKYKVGVLVKEVTPLQIAETVQAFFENENACQQARSATQIAALELNWEKEKHILHAFMEKI